MERLTEKHYDGKGYFMKCSEACANDDEMCGGCPQLDKIIDRLAAYEDTGLTPEQVAAQKWIPVSERLPEGGSVLCITQGGHYKVLEWLETFKCWQDPGGIDFTNFRLEYITHWMPLPKSPMEG